MKFESAKMRECESFMEKESLWVCEYVRSKMLEFTTFLSAVSS